MRDDFGDLDQRNHDEQLRIEKASEQEPSLLPRSIRYRRTLPVAVQAELANLLGRNYPVETLNFSAKFLCDGHGFSWFVYDPAGDMIGRGWYRGKEGAEQEAARCIAGLVKP